MSQKLIIPRLNYASNFNFFFKNTTKSLLKQQNFIGNQYLTSTYRKLITGTPARHKNHSDSAFVQFQNQSQNPNHPSLSSKTSNESLSNPENGTILQNVATKVLNCQDLDAPLGQRISTSDNGQVKSTSTPIPDTNVQSNHIPFAVKPKCKSTSASSKPDLRALINPYIKLTKPNLTVLVTLSCICSYSLSPLTVSLPQLVFLTLGTALCSGAANAINMGREPEFDKHMARTSLRPVVRGIVTPKQSYQFAAATGTIGCLMLYWGVNPTVSLLGALNIVLYSWIYTSLKRKSIINTWVGAIVGAIPPLMGWAASSPLLHPGGLCLAGLLYAWQFPHFNALSHNVADQYKGAGYFMTAAENPRLNARVALRYSILMFPLCFGLSYFGVTDWVFQIDSAIANIWLTYLAFNFWKQQEKNYANGAKPTAEGLQAAGFHAKKLFWCSVWQLPAILILAMLHKKGQWDRLFYFLGIKSPEDYRDSTSNLDTI